MEEDEHDFDKFGFNNDGINVSPVWTQTALKDLFDLQDETWFIRFSRSPIANLNAEETLYDLADNGGAEDSRPSSAAAPLLDHNTAGILIG